MKRRKGKRVSLSSIIETSRERIFSKGFLAAARKRLQDFTRNRKLPFTLLVMFMLNRAKESTQVRLDSFFEGIGQEGTNMTQQSYSDARDKMKWEALRELFDLSANFVYTGYYETWQGYRVSAVDGSKIQMPDDVKLRDYFGTAGKGGTAATGQGSVLYDVLNDVVMDAYLEPITTDERTLALRHIKVLHGMPSFFKELVIFDRGYPSFELIKDMKERGISFLMRVRRKFSVHIDRLGEGDNAVVLEKQGEEGIAVRVIKFTLPSGEEETLITDITDEGMGISEFKALYFKRWPVETKYGEVKNKLEIENFTGRTLNSVMQDFYATMYMTNIITVAKWEAQEKMDAGQEGKDNKYAYHVNANHAIGTFRDRFIKAMLEPNPRRRSKKVGRILHLMAGNAVPTRPDRSRPRNPTPRKAKFRHNMKSNC